jgi:hypothetical protein
MTIKTTPVLGPLAQKLVSLYDQTPGSSGPYCCPEGVAAILDEIAARHERSDLPFTPIDLVFYAALLRGVGSE